MFTMSLMSLFLKFGPPSRTLVAQWHSTDCDSRRIRPCAGTDHVEVVPVAGMIAQLVARPTKLHGTCILSVTYITYEGAKPIESRRFASVAGTKSARGGDWWHESRKPCNRP